MRIYEGTIKEFNADIVHNRLADRISANFTKYYRRSPHVSEYRSWQQSLAVLNNSLLHPTLTENKIIVEYELPYSTRRIDVLLFGTGEDWKDNVVLIELKQWSNEYVDDCEVDGNVVVDYGNRKTPEAHPALKVQGYHFDLEDFLTVFEQRESISLSSCTYCHNYSRSGTNDVLFYPKFSKIIKTFPVFSKEDSTALADYLKKRLSKGPGLEVFNRFITSPIRPSKRLLEHTGEMINKRQIFNLIDDQITAYNTIMHKAKALARTGRKSIIIVKGGPGTGKSVIALEVMGELMRQGKVVYHATGSSAFTNTLRKIVGRRAKNLFHFFFSFTQHKDNEIDVLICDEAHRIRAHSNDYGVPGKFKSKNPQIQDLIRPAKLSVFFIDEHQVVRPNEIGSMKLIKETAREFGADDTDIAEFELTTQFRCSGSDAYLQWLDKTLGVRDSDIVTFEHKMEFRIFDNPSQLQREIRARNNEKSNSARIVAGFCWPWSSPKPDGSLVKDVKIGSFEMPWEKKDKFWEWATHESGMEQVGTVYTSQGFEFDYIGVIFGNDLIYDPQQRDWVSRPENSHDSSAKRKNTDVTKHLKNIYRVLLSRAHRGVYVYFMDKNTEKYFRERLLPSGTSQPPSPALPHCPTSSKPQFLEDLNPDDSVDEHKKYVEYLPVYSLEAAASGFSENQEVEKLGWKKVACRFKLLNEHFVAKVVGRSMEPTIPDGSYCVFRRDKGGSRNGLITLVKSIHITDPENGYQYTVKRYHSEKTFFSDGTWSHKKIMLTPDNKEFEDIQLLDVLPGDFSVIAEFVCCL